jgi:hypothetical protein
MSQADQSAEWYLARDGQQHGPISAPEMNKIIELGYLLPTDLVWRQGLADWQPASVAFPTKAAEPSPPPAPPAPPPPASHGITAPTAPAPDDSAKSATTRDREPLAKDAAPRGSGRETAQRGPDPREVIATEAARREEAARRAREQMREPSMAWPTQGTGAPAAAGGGARQPMPGAQFNQPKADPRTGPRLAAHPPIDADKGGEDWDDDAPRRRVPRLLVASLVILLLLGGAGFALHVMGQLDPLINRISTATPEKPDAPVVQAKPEAKRVTAVGFSDNPTQIDTQFQRSELWRLLKTEFPDWYQERVRDTARLKSEGKADKDISQMHAEQLVALRRKHVTDALSASPRNLKSVATTFLDNLEQLSKHSTDACYGFISQGETNPLIVELTRASEHTPALQKQTSAIFAAIAEGRKMPAKHRPPSREDYDQLAAQLAKRGWSPADLQLFSDARSLARASPDRVCKMVRDWFAAQLSVPDEEVQVRLLMEALKPVVAG